MTPSRIRHLSESQITCLKRYATFEASLDELRACLSHVVSFDFEGAKGSMYNDFVVTEPGIPITRWHIENALTKRKHGEITEGDLIDWATVLLLNHSYELDEKDEDVVAKWLHDISFDLHQFPE